MRRRTALSDGRGCGSGCVGLVLGIVWRQQTKRRWIGWSVFAAGVFLGGSAWMIRTFYDSALTFLCVVVPVVMLLGILWNLYDRECSWSLTILGASLIALVGLPAGAGQHLPGYLCPDRCGSLYRGTDRSWLSSPTRRTRMAASWAIFRC